MDKAFICVITEKHCVPIKARIKASDIVEYGEFTSAGAVVGAYICTSRQEHIVVSQTVDEIDMALETLGYYCLEILKTPKLREIYLEPKSR